MMSQVPVTIEDTEFLDHFLALPPGIPLTSHLPERKSSPFTGLELANRMIEDVVFDAFQHAVNSKRLAPGLKLRRCEEQPGYEHIGRINAALFPLKRPPKNGIPNCAADELVSVVFLDYDKSRDPFDRTQTDTDLRMKTRGKIFGHTDLVFHVQHRTFLLMLLVMRRRVRVMRWDRSGVVTTRAIDYVEDWKLLCDILSRISILANHSPDRFGFDPSATRIYPKDPRWKTMDSVAIQQVSDADEKERDLGDGELTEPFTYACIRKIFRKSLKHNWPRYELKVPDDAVDGGVRRFLVCYPVHQRKGPASRGTRSYVAFDLTTQRFSWLKDTWRLDLHDVEREGDILSKLNAAKVRHVPTLICHGDIPDQITQTANFWEDRQLKSFGVQGSQPSGSKRKREGDAADDVFDPLHRRHRHYRLVVEEVCMPLHTFTSGEQLLSLVYDCVLAHRDAWTSLNLTHGDISGGNILVYPRIAEFEGKRIIKWEGILGDWELAIDTREMKRRRRERVGTWQFMSANLLSSKPETFGITDELESFFYVILYYSVRYLESNITDVPAFIENLFDEYGLWCGKYQMGPKKAYTIKTPGDIIIAPQCSSDILYFSTPLDEFIHELRRRFVSLYKVRAHESEKLIPPTVPPSATNRRMAPRRVLDDSERIVSTPEILESLERFEEQSKARRKAEEDAKIPTQQDRARAAEVADYDYMLSLLLSHVDAKWPPACNQGDLIAADSQSKRDSDRDTTPSIQALHTQGKSASIPPVMDVPPAGGPAVVGREVEEKKRRIRAPRVQRQGVRRSARVASKA